MTWVRSMRRWGSTTAPGRLTSRPWWRLRQVGDREGEGLAFGRAHGRLARAAPAAPGDLLRQTGRSTGFKRSGSHSGPSPTSCRRVSAPPKRPSIGSWPRCCWPKGGCSRPSRCSICSKRKNTPTLSAAMPAPPTAVQGRVALTPEEAAWAARYRAIADRLAALGPEYGALRPSRHAPPTRRSGWAPKRPTSPSPGRRFEQFLAHLQVEVWQAPQVQERIARLAEESQGLMDALRDLGPGTVALYTLVTDTAYHVILTTPEVQLAREQSDRRRRPRPQSPRLPPGPRPGQRGSVLRDPRPLARELYQLLVAPIAQDLRQAQATTLMWSLDGVLALPAPGGLARWGAVPARTLPPGGLHPRQRHAPQRPAPAPGGSGVGFGVSKAHGGFRRCPPSPTSCAAIIRDPTQRNPEGVLPGLIHLDEAFTDAALRAALRQRHPVVHIASHFQLHPGDDTASFLLLGRRQPPAPWRSSKPGRSPFRGSSCSPSRPAIRRWAVRGRRGKKSKAWPSWPSARAPRPWWPPCGRWWMRVRTELMQTFYRLRESQPGLPKAEALRQAQRPCWRRRAARAASGARDRTPEPVRGSAAPPPLAQIGSVANFEG